MEPAVAGDGHGDLALLGVAPEQLLGQRPPGPDVAGRVGERAVAQHPLQLIRPDAVRQVGEEAALLARRHRVEHVPLVVVRQVGRGLEQVVDHRGVAAERGQLRIGPLGVGVGHVGVVERLEVVEVLGQAAQVGLPGEGRAGLVGGAGPGLPGQRARLLDQVEEGRGDPRHRPGHVVHMPQGAVLGQGAGGQPLQADLHRTGGEPQGTGGSQQAPAGRLQDPRGEQPRGAQGLGQVPLHRQQVIGGRGVGQVDQPVVDAGEELDGRDHAPEPAPALVPVRPVGVQQLLQLAGLGEHQRQQRPGKQAERQPGLLQLGPAEPPGDPEQGAGPAAHQGAELRLVDEVRPVAHAPRRGGAPHAPLERPV